MSALGYLRPHASCEYLTAGRLYPLIQRGINTETFAVVDDNHSTHGFSKEWLDDHGGFDYLPPDNGLGWVKLKIKTEIFPSVDAGQCLAVTGTNSFGHFKADGLDGCACTGKNFLWEYIPPYAEQVEDKEMHIPMAVHSAISQIEKNEAAERDQPGIRSYEELRRIEQEKRDTEIKEKQLKEIAEKHGYLVMANDAQERATKPMGMGKW